MSAVPFARIVSLGLLFCAACHQSPPETAPATPVAGPGAETTGRARAPSAENAPRPDASPRTVVGGTEGTPAVEQARRQRADAAAQALVLAKIFFDFDADSLGVTTRSTLDAKLPVLRANSGLHIRIDGNADDRGTAEYNLLLGERRAVAAKRYLVANGIDSARIATTSEGEEQPVCREEVEACWSVNRRDEFVITAGAEALYGTHQ